MHGLINRSIQCFLRDTYGAGAWAQVVRGAGLGFDSFEAMLTYDPVLTDAVLDAATQYAWVEAAFAVRRNDLCRFPAISGRPAGAGASGPAGC